MNCPGSVRVPVFVVIGMLLAIGAAFLSSYQPMRSVDREVGAGGSTVAARDIMQPVTSAASRPDEATRKRVQMQLIKLPLIFEENLGQTDSRVAFLARARGYTLFLGRNEMVLRTRESGRRVRSDSASRRFRREARHCAVRVTLVDASPDPHMAGQLTTGGRSNYLKGNDPAKWVTGVRHFTKVHCKGVYPDTDLVYYGKQGLLEYDFVLSPGGDPYAITLSYEGLSGSLRIADDGGLVLPTELGDLVQHRPYVYQTEAGKRREIAGEYVLKGEGKVGFRVAAYDTSRTLVIDPVLEVDYSTYLGGGEDDELGGITADASGSAIVTGESDSTDFPTTAGVLSSSSAGSADAVVAKLDSSGSSLEFATYLGGSEWDSSETTPALDGSGNITLTGFTSSSDFPVTPGAYLTTYGGMGAESFVAKLDSTGSSLLYSSFLGGSGDPIGVGIDGSGNIYVTGEAYNGSMATTTGAFQETFMESDSLFKSGDAGNNWGASGTGITIGVAVYDIAIDPVTPTTLYAATNDGIFKSTNGGASWATASTGLTTTYALSVTIDSTSPSTLYAGTGDGVFKSTNGATSWSDANGGTLNGFMVERVVVDPSSPSTLYAGVGFGGGVYKSLDGAVSWNDSSNGLSDRDIVDLAIDPTTPSTLYAVSHFSGVFKSTDSGANWSDSNGSLDEPEAMAIAVDPSSPNTLYMATEESDAFKSTDGGSSWSTLNIGAGDELSLRDIAIDPTSTSTVYLASDEGLLKSTDGGTTWSTINTGLLASFLFTVAVDPLTSTNVYTGGDRPSDAYLVKLNPAGAGAADLVYATFIGGNGVDASEGLAVDSSGVAWISGTTRSTSFPVTTGAYQMTSLGGAEAFLVGIDPAGSGASDLLYGTYLGGSDDDLGGTMALDALGNAFLTGTTNSTDFPATAGAFQTANAGGFDGFLAKLNPSGAGAADLVFATYFGGSAADAVWGAGINSGGNIILVGNTTSTDLPTSDGFQDTLKGGIDGFIAVLGVGGGSVAASSYFGGTGLDEIFGAHVDASGNVYIVGFTESGNLKTRALQGSLKGEADGFVAKIKVNIEVQRPVAIFTATPEEGFAPLLVNLDGSASNDPGGGTITNYAWDFGNGTTTSGMNAVPSLTYGTTDSYVVSLTVTNSAGITSEPATLAIVAGDGITGDTDLYTNKGQFGINYKNHAKGVANDTIKLTGIINPAGLPANLSGAMVQLTINNVPIGAPTAVRSSARRGKQRASKGFSFLPLIKSNGSFSFSVKGADLRPTLGVRDESTEQAVRTEIRAEITGVSIKTPTIKGVIKTPFKTKKGAKSKGAFSFIKLPTPTGAFKSQVTTAAEGATAGEYRVVAKGPIVGEFSTPLVPTGDVTITIGDGGGSGAVIVVPVGAFSSKGAGAKSVFNYSKSLQEIPQLKKFQINNAKKKFMLATNDLASTGIPAAGAGGTEHELPIVIDVPTAAGPLNLTTDVELKRSSAGSNKWKR